jgi:hypothetical protein
VFADLPQIAIDATLLAVVLPSGCERRLVPLLSAHFLVYGDEVAEALRRPPPGCYASDCLDCPRVPWSALYRLMCSVAIHPSITSGWATCLEYSFSIQDRQQSGLSRPRTCNVFAGCGCRFLSVAWFVHLPFGSHGDMPDAYYISAVLKFEYDVDVIHCLTLVRGRTTEVTATRGQNIEGSRRQLSAGGILPCVARPIPQTTVFSCLNNYYQASKWSDPQQAYLSKARMKSRELIGPVLENSGQDTTNYYVTDYNFIT